MGTFRLCEAAIDLPHAAGRRGDPESVEAVDGRLTSGTNMYEPSRQPLTQTVVAPLPRARREMNPQARTASAGVAYFLAMLVASWIFGPIRHFFVGSGADPLLAALAEAPAMALVMVYAAGWSVAAFSVPLSPTHRLVVGSTAVTLLLLADWAREVFMQGRSFSDFIARFYTAPGVAFAATLLLGVILPLLRERKT
jgi:hypothetical protein